MRVTILPYFIMLTKACQYSRAMVSMMAKGSVVA